MTLFCLWWRRRKTSFSREQCYRIGAKQLMWPSPAMVCAINKNAAQSAAATRVLFVVSTSIEVVGLVGFEPTASASRTQRSTKLSHSP